MPPQLNTVDSNTVHKSVSGNKLHSFQQGLTELMIIKAAIHSTVAMDVVLKDQNVSKPLHISGSNPKVVLHKFINKQLDCFRGLWSFCQNIGSPVSLGLFEGQNGSKCFQKSLPQLCM